MSDAIKESRRAWRLALHKALTLYSVSCPHCHGDMDRIGFVLKQDSESIHLVTYRCLACLLKASALLQYESYRVYDVEAVDFLIPFYVELLPNQTHGREVENVEGMGI